MSGPAHTESVRAEASASGGPGGRGRRVGRLGSWVLAGVFLLGVGASVVLANVLADRLNRRVDVTALETHRLSDRTQQLLGSLEGEYRLVVAGPWSAPPRVQQRQALPEPGSIRRVFDTLEEIERASERFSLVRLDTASRAGQRRFSDELERMVERDAASIDEIDAALEASIDEAEGIAGELDRLSDELRGASERLVERDAIVRALRRLAGEASAASSRLEQGAARVRSRAEERIGDVPVRAVDRGLSSARELMGRADEQLTRLREGLESTRSARQLGEELGGTLARIGRAAGSLRDRAAIRADRLDRLETPASVRVARTLLTGNAALLLAPPGTPGPGLIAIGFDALFPSASGDGADGDTVLDVGRKAEDAVANALAALTRPSTPIVVFVHAETQRWVLDSSALASLRDHLAMRRIDVREWATVVDEDPPSVLSAPGSTSRPVVYVAVGTSGVRTSGASEQMNGPARAERLGEAVDRIIEAGEPLLLAAGPSWPAAAYDGTDHTTAFLRGFGLRADAGRTVVTRSSTSEGRLLEFIHRVMPERGEFPILRAIRGLPVTLKWPIAFAPTSERPDDVASLTRTPLLRIEDQAAWAEKEWLSARRAAQRQRADSLRGSGLPSPTPSLDDTTGPWTVAYAAQRRVRGESPQRVVVVGSNRWFIDAQTTAGRSVGGRAVASNPGNRPLFDAAVYWLAGQDEMVAASASARPVARVRELSDSTRAAIGWALIGGLPLLVLMVGVGYRLLAG